MEHLPDIDSYEVNLQSDANQKELFDWWKENKDKPFNMRQQLVDYCIDDTVWKKRSNKYVSNTIYKYNSFFQILLYEGCQIFINTILQLSNELYQKTTFELPLQGNGIAIRKPPWEIQETLSKKKALGSLDITEADLTLDEVTIHPANIHPFSRSFMTLSSLGYRLFRTFCLRDNFTLPNLKLDSLTTVSARASRIELECLSYMKARLWICQLNL